MTRRGAADRLSTASTTEEAVFKDQAKWSREACVVCGFGSGFQESLGIAGNSVFMPAVFKVRREAAAICHLLD